MAIVGSLTLMYAIDEPDTPSLLINVVIICALGVFSNIAATIGAESANWSSSKQWGYKIAVAIGLLLFYFLFLPVSYDVYSPRVFRLPFQIAAIIIFLHLLIAYIPFVSKGSEEDFWEYNKDVFLRFVESMFYAVFLFVGLAIALLALDKLFGIELDGVAYPRLFIFLVGIFHTLYFLSKYPVIFYDNQIKKPIKAFLIFSQYILIPLVLIYLAILYAYAIQIGIKWELPEGWVSQLSLWFSVVGIFAFLLNYFNHKFSDFKPTAYFKKYFFPALLLPTVLVFIAIYRRISEYGVTELRYVVALLGVWLLGITLYYNLSKTKSIKVIPISLSIIVLLPILTGPFNMFNASLSSQQKRFKQSLIDKSILVGDQLTPLDKESTISVANNTELSSKTDSLYNAYRFELSASIRYLDDRSDLQFINKWISEDLEFVSYDNPTWLIDSLDQYHNARILANKLDIAELFPRYNKPREGKRYDFHHNQNSPIKLDENKYFVPISGNRNQVNSQTIYLILNEKGDGLRLTKNSETIGEIDLLEYYKNLINNTPMAENARYNLSIDNPLLEVNDSTYHASLIINSLSGRQLEDNSITIESIWGHAIITFK